MSNEPIREISNPGASGSLFFVSNDDNFIVKTVQHKEATFLQQLLQGYYMVNDISASIVIMLANNMHVIILTIIRRILGKIVNGWKPLTVFAKNSNLDLWLGSWYVILKFRCAISHCDTNRCIQTLICLVCPYLERARKIGRTTGLYTDNIFQYRIGWRKIDWFHKNHVSVSRYF